MPSARVWPLVERETVRWLDQHLLAAVYTETPPTDLPAEYVTVEQAGGSEGAVDREYDIEIGVLATSRTRMWEVARLVESVMGRLAASGTPGMYVDDVTCRFVFRSDPPPNQDRRRAIATFTLTVRPRA